MRRNKVCLNEIYNFIVDTFFGNHLRSQVCICSYTILNFKILDDLGWKINQNQSCRYQWKLQHCSWWIFHWNPLRSKSYVSSQFEIQICQTVLDGEMMKTKMHYYHVHSCDMGIKNQLWCPFIVVFVLFLYPFFAWYEWFCSFERVLGSVWM